MNDSAGSADTEETQRRLREWNISGMGLHPDGSNYVFVVRLDDPAVERAGADDDTNSLYGIYKPRAGERPLHDFPGGTLHLRERAAFVLSEVLGWPLVPPTVVRDGPHGEGSVQLFIDADPEANYFTLRDESLDLFAPTAMFDVLAYNADRKGGSCLKAKSDGRLWAIDHGLTFNPLARRRTVMFEFNGMPYPPELKSGISRLLWDAHEAGLALGITANSVRRLHRLPDGSPGPLRGHVVGSRLKWRPADVRKYVDELGDQS